MNIQVSLLIENRIYREGIASYFNSTGDFVVGDSFGSVACAGPRLAVQATDVVVVDSLVADMLALVHAIKCASQEVRVVVILLGHDDALLRACVTAGVEGFLTCDDGMQDLCACVQNVHAGRICYPREVARLFIKGVSRQSRSSLKPPAVMERLTERQIAVIQLLEDGCSNKVIARELGIELATVKNHVHQILERLEVSNRSQAVATYRRICAGPAVVPFSRSGK